MEKLIETTPIQGFKVYGQQMVEYTVDGAEGKDFAFAIAIASLAESSSIEVEADAYAAVLRTRQRKLTELGSALAILNSAIATMKTGSGQRPSDTSSADAALNTAHDIFERYGLSLPVSNNKVTRGDAEKGRANGEYAMDVENNDMQQDMITLQGLISKRDNSFSTAAKVLKKVDSTGKSIIRSIGS